MSASRAFHDAVHEAKTKPTPAPDWTWRSTGTLGLFGLWRDGDEIGMISFLPGSVQRESVLLDEWVETLNAHQRS